MGQLLGGIQEEGDYKWQSEEVENEMLYKRTLFSAYRRTLIHLHLKKMAGQFIEDIFPPSVDCKQCVRNFMGQLLGGIKEEGDYKWQSEEVENEMLYKRLGYSGKMRQLISYTQGNRNSEKSQKEKGPIEGRH
ncbi:hypothetical protein C0J52_27962 [Blattella germanica]|nr:hypothetical protein C0J52_27962 [Blattella germanica]